MNKTTLKATKEKKITSSKKVMMTGEMFRHYMIFPKIVFSEFAVFYAPEDYSPELQLELQMILGLDIKFEFIPQDLVLARIKSFRKSDRVYF